MAVLDDFGKGLMSPVGLALGVGTVLLAPVLAPAVRNGLRPLAKTVLRAGITFYRDTVEPVTDAFNDLVTEAELELAAASAGSGTEPEHAEAASPSSGSKRARRPEAGG